MKVLSTALKTKAWPFKKVERKIMVTKKRNPTALYPKNGSASKLIADTAKIIPEA